jgi:hypothetical protein
MSERIIPSKTIRIKTGDGEVITVKSEDYVKTATKALREFGYNKLTEDEVREQLGKVLLGGTLDAIGMFIAGDIIK